MTWIPVCVRDAHHPPSIEGYRASTVMPVQLRQPYMQALGSASAGPDISRFAEFIGKLNREQTATPLLRDRLKKPKESGCLHNAV
jgi:hypothetical protein